MGTQLAYGYYHTDGDPGTPADLNPMTTDTLVNASGFPLAFGMAIKEVAGQAAILAGSGDIVAGVICKVLDQNTIGLTAPNIIGVNEPMVILRKGRVKVLVEEAVNPNDPAFVRFVAGAGGTVIGAWRKSADTASASAVKGARYCQTWAVAAGGIAWLEFDYQLAAS